MVSRSNRVGHNGGRIAAALGAAALLATACGSGQDVAADPAETATTDGSAALSVAVASFDVAVGDDQRLLAGLFTGDRELLVFGDVSFQLGFLGEEAGGETELSQQTTAEFLPIPGMEPEGSSDEPILVGGSDGSGVYAGHVDLDEPGFWGLRVVAELADGRVLEGQATFNVLPETEVPAVGDEAPRSENITVADVEAGTVEPVALDSRAQGDDTSIPDPHLHDASIAASIEAGRPVVVIVATPVYCVSRFCGPLVSTLAETATQYADRAEFVHLEVWEDFDEQRLNAAAEEWIQAPSGGREPWVFLVGADGRIAARWDNVLELSELEAHLEALPSLAAAGSLEGDDDA